MVSLALTVVACRYHHIAPAGVVDRAQPNSTLSDQANVLVRAMDQRDIAAIRDRFSLKLREHTSRERLKAAMTQLRRHFGHPLGVLEEHIHREGTLVWYSGLWLYRRSTRSTGGHHWPRLAPVLYQFAVGPDQRIASILIREHAFLESTRAPAEHYVPITRFHWPGRGTWTVSNGGRTRAENGHHGSVTQRFAYDLVMTRNGRRRRPGSNARRNASYYCYGQAILAPAAGTVVKAIDGVAENIPGVRGRGGGNGVVIDHGFGEYSSLWHAIPGTVRVRVGDRVETGQVVGRTGNSGRSTGPHIHFGAHTLNHPGGDFALPSPFVDVSVDGRWHVRAEPVRGQKVSADRPRTPLRQVRSYRPTVVLAR